MISIIDYGVGNIGSIINMIKKVGGVSEVINDPSQLDRAQKLLLPGVGSFDHGMSNLAAWKNSLDHVVLEKKTPILGICLGMQLLANRSEEGKLAGLGWIDADVVRFDTKIIEQHLRIPHMGWNTVDVKKANPLLNETEENRFYFVHAYHIQCKNVSDVLSESKHGYTFASAVSRGNIYGVQFHPEKSHKFGMALIKKYLELKC